MTMTNGHPGAARSVGRIGLWGAPGCGKTTFLAALNIAVTRAATQELRVFGVDEASTGLLVENTIRLTRDRQFPEVTASWAPVQLGHANGGPGTGAAPVWQADEDHRPARDEPGPTRRAGTGFADIPEKSASAWSGGGRDLGFDDDDADADEVMPAAEESVMDRLASCDGLLLLFDPTREWTSGDAFNYFQGTLLRIAQRRMTGRATPGGRLPQYVAVCATKFDHPDVYRRAKNRGYRSLSVEDPYMFPQGAGRTGRDVLRRPGAAVRAGQRGPGRERAAPVLRAGPRPVLHHLRHRLLQEPQGGQVPRGGLHEHRPPAERRTSRSGERSTRSTWWSR